MMDAKTLNALDAELAPRLDLCTCGTRVSLRDAHIPECLYRQIREALYVCAQRGIQTEELTKWNLQLREAITRARNVLDSQFGPAR